MPHVPTVDIRRLGDIRFDTQLEKALAPSPDYDVQQWLFVPNEYTEYRYILGTRGKKPLICIGINPSTARPGDLDPTLQSVERVARNNGFDSFIMFRVMASDGTGGSSSPQAVRLSAMTGSIGSNSFFIVCVE